MRFLDLIFDSPAENLALEEALLDEAEAAGEPRETLRLWEPAAPLVVVGRSSKIAQEVRCDACQRDGVPVLRRASGGAAVVSGPGCLMYALVLSYELRPVLRAVDDAHRHVLGILAGALRPHVAGVRCQGISDLVLGDRKFSGNSVRCKRSHLLYHGTMLYDFPLEWIERYLCMPPRQPAYRQQRGHEAFVVNLPLDRAALREALSGAFQATEPCAEWPAERVADLVAQRYGRPEWNA
jgi:lipoate-protein ligase A